MDPLAKHTPTESGNAEIRPDIVLYYELWEPSTKPKGKLVMLTGVCATLLHFQKFADHLAHCGYQVLLFDHLGTGKSVTDSRILKSLKYTTLDYARNCLELLNIIWKNGKIHVFGMSFGGMVSQRLAVLLQKEDRLQSLFIANSTLCLGKWMRFIPRFCIRLFAKYNKPSLVKLIKQTFHEEFLDQTHPLVGTSYRKLIQSKWDKEFTQWFNFNNDLSESIKFHACANHHLNEQEIQMLQKVKTSVWIAIGDPVMPTRQQQHMGKRLKATCFEIHSGLHTLGDFRELSQFLEFLISHLDSSSTFTV
ncbi:hypothetical protein HDV06_007109 [Boothiomyces sp. JEL0866]|nr:hypothetical protein HDV06_007109 [Boothiomyces sp. JEL0866]